MGEQVVLEVMEQWKAMKETTQGKAMQWLQRNQGDEYSLTIDGKHV